MLNIDHRERDRPLLSGLHREEFDRQGYLHVRRAFSRLEMQGLRSAVEALSTPKDSPAVASDRPDTWMWPRSPAVADLIFGGSLGTMASQLLRTDGIRLISDVLFRRMGHVKGTPWHRDSDFWNFTDGSALTMWIPLQDTPASMALQYVAGSHTSSNLRMLRRFEKALVSASRPIQSFDMSLGDIAIHHYRTLHASTRYREPHLRQALAIHLIDANARFRAPIHRFQDDHNRRCKWDILRDGDEFPDAIAPLIFAR